MGEAAGAAETAGGACCVSGPAVTASCAAAWRTCSTPQPTARIARLDAEIPVNLFLITDCRIMNRRSLYRYPTVDPGSFPRWSPAVMSDGPAFKQTTTASNRQGDCLLVRGLLLL